MLSTYFYTLAVLVCSIAPAAARSRGKAYHFSSSFSSEGKQANTTCSPITNAPTREHSHACPATMWQRPNVIGACNGFTPGMASHDFNDRTCHDATGVTSIYVEGTDSKTCSYWSQEANCLGHTVARNHRKKAGKGRGLSRTCTYMSSANIATGCEKIVIDETRPDENGYPTNEPTTYKSVRYTLVSRSIRWLLETH